MERLELSNVEVGNAAEGGIELFREHGFVGETDPLCGEAAKVREIGLHDGSGGGHICLSERKAEEFSGVAFHSADRIARKRKWCMFKTLITKRIGFVIGFGSPFGGHCYSCSGDVVFG